MMKKVRLMIFRVVIHFINKRHLGNPWAMFSYWFFLVAISIMHILMITGDWIKFNFLNEDELYLQSVFSGIITISVLSMTILSILTNSNKKYYGITFQRYNSFNSFPIKFNQLLSLSFLTMLLSYLAFMTSNIYILGLYFIYIIVVLAISAVIYFNYVMNDNRIRKFLLDKKTLSENGYLILYSSYNYFLDGWMDRGQEENNLILDFIKKVKEEVEHDEKD